MFSTKQLENILFVDIETASLTPDHSVLPEPLHSLWHRKADLLRMREDEYKDDEQLFGERAAIFAEFGKVVCISCGFIRFNGDKPSFRLKSFFGQEEKPLLEGFAKLLNDFMGNPSRNLCAHNGKEFDFPYLGRRYLINGMRLPDSLAEIQTKKPWEVRLLDTMQMWKFGDFKSYTSLDLLCAVLDVPSPKEDMDGSQVGRTFWIEKDYEKIAHYCERDVLATAQVMLRMFQQPLIEDADISHA
jgi:hypothetical protein